MILGKKISDREKVEDTKTKKAIDEVQALAEDSIPAIKVAGKTITVDDLKDFNENEIKDDMENTSLVLRSNGRLIKLIYTVLS